MENIVPTVPVKKLELQLVSYCNLKCIYCANEADMKLSSIKMPMWMVKHCIDELLPEYVNLTGGENSLAVSLLIDAATYARSKNVKVYWSTNLTMETPVLDSILTMGLINEIHVSVDAYNASDYKAINGGTLRQFSNLVNNIKHIRTMFKEIPLYAETILMEKTYKKIDKIREFLWKMKVDNQSIVPLHPIGMMDNEFNKVLDYDTMFDYIMANVLPNKIKGMKMKFSCFSFPHCVEKYEKLFYDIVKLDPDIVVNKCGAQKDYLYVLADGRVTFCFIYVPKNLPRIGMLKDGRKIGVKEIWDTHPLFKAVHFKRVSGCESCKSFDSCRNDCLGLAFKYNKDPYEKIAFDLNHLTFVNGRKGKFTAYPKGGFCN